MYRILNTVMCKRFVLFLGADLYFGEMLIRRSVAPGRTVCSSNAVTEQKGKRILGEGGDEEVKGVGIIHGEGGGEEVKGVGIIRTRIFNISTSCKIEIGNAILNV